MTLRHVRAGRLLFLLYLNGAFLPAQDSPPPAAAASGPITTDRPAFTDASTVVSAGSLVFENGFLETGTPGQRSFDFPETLARLGISDKTEIRLTVPDYYQNFHAGMGYGSGWGDTLLGLKQQLGPTQGFDVSLVVSVSLPTGAKRLSSHGYDPQFQVPWSRGLSANWTAAGMFSFFWPTEGPKRVPTGQVTFLLDRQLTKRWDAFTEYAGTFAQGSGPQQILHSGTAYKLTPDQQIDFHAGVGLSAAAVDHLVGFGYSIRFHLVNQ
jgi:hypothetical protein